MKVGDFVKVTIESGFTDIGFIVKVEKDPFGDWYQIACQESKTDCIATEDMLEIISESQ